MARSAALFGARSRTAFEFSKIFAGFRGRGLTRFPTQRGAGNPLPRRRAPSIQRNRNSPAAVGTKPQLR